MTRMHTLFLLAGVATLIQAAPLPPKISPGAGSFACPVTVTLSAINPRATIFFTLNGGTPVPNAAGTTKYSSPISINGGTLRAVSMDNTGTSVPATAVFLCNNDLVSFKVTIETGDDDARTDSAITATMAMNSGKSDSFCLKYSDNGAASPCPKSHPGITWGNFNTNSVTRAFDSGGHSAADFNTLTIALTEFPGFAKGDDNWDVFSLRVDGTTKSGSTVNLMNIQGPSASKSGCYARFKHPHGEKTSTVVFHFNRSIKDVVQDDNGPHNALYCPD
jgi:Chitobiase/beta-hexosaminidase C-terminal domain